MLIQIGIESDIIQLCYGQRFLPTVAGETDVELNIVLLYIYILLPGVIT